MHTKLNDRLMKFYIHMRRVHTLSIGYLWDTKNSLRGNK